MKVLLLILLLGVGAILPFVWLKQPWAVRFWRRTRLILIIYALIIFVVALLRLAFNWDSIYG